MPPAIPLPRRAGALACLVLLPLLGACQTNPVTGRSQFNALSREDEIRIGEESLPQLVEGYGGRLGMPGVEGYVAGVGEDLARYTELDYPTLPWEFTVLDSDVVNAFALPGGKVFISRELLSRMTNEAQLAGVLGHEIGHVTGQHADDTIGRQMILAGLAIGGAVVAGVSDDDAVRIGAGAVVATSGVFALTFNRSQELEADKLGMRYMKRAGYRPDAMEQVMEILAGASAGGAPPEFLSTHPHPQTRIKAIRKRLKNPGMAATLTDPAFGFYPERFERSVLAPLRAAADARPRTTSPAAAGAPIADPNAWAHIAALDAPRGFCLHCAMRRSAGGFGAR